MGKTYLNETDLKREAVNGKGKTKDNGLEWDTLKKGQASKA